MGVSREAARTLPLRQQPDRQIPAPAGKTARLALPRAVRRRLDGRPRAAGAAGGDVSDAVAVA